MLKSLLTSVPKGNYEMFRIGVVTNCQKLGIKRLRNYCYQKMCSCIGIFSMKKIKKDFDHF